MTLLKEILSTSATRPFLSILMGFLVGAVFMMVSGQDVAKAWEAGGLPRLLAPQSKRLPMAMVLCSAGLFLMPGPMTSQLRCGL